MLESLSVLHEWNMLEETNKYVESDTPKLSDLDWLDHVLSIVQY